jgi:hybrid cluster-associated redox disulfide protein
MITKEMTIGQVIRENPDKIPVFLRNGLTCIGCPMSSFETIEQGAVSHGIDVEKLVRELNGSEKKGKKALAKKKK